MPKKFYTSSPGNYPIRQPSECPLASSCLHQSVYAELLRKEVYLNLINSNKCSMDENCQFYRSNIPVKYAIGFTNFQKRMFPEQYFKFMYILIGTFGRNPYFERRRGETALLPKEQEIVMKTLKRAGVTEDFKFDKYVENLNCYD